MPLIDDDDVVQTLAADRADDAFDVGILPGRARCRADGRETEGLDRPTERRIEGVLLWSSGANAVACGLSDFQHG